MRAVGLRVDVMVVRDEYEQCDDGRADQDGAAAAAALLLACHGLEVHASHRGSLHALDGSCACLNKPQKAAVHVVWRARRHQVHASVLHAAS